MQTKKKHSTKILIYISVILMTSYFFVSISPISKNGTLIKENILLGALLLGFSVYCLVELVVGDVLKFRNPAKLSVLVAFTLTEVAMIGSLNLLNVWSLLAATLFNALTYWYLFRRFNK